MQPGTRDVLAPRGNGFHPVLEGKRGRRLYPAFHTRRGYCSRGHPARLSLSRGANVPGSSVNPYAEVSLRWNHFRKADSYPRVLACCAMFVAVLVTLVLYATPASSAAPHIIYILTDDLGSNYPGCTYPWPAKHSDGSDVRTRIDSLDLP